MNTREKYTRYIDSNLRKKKTEKKNNENDKKKIM